jgi:hypothetical protein
VIIAAPGADVAAADDGMVAIFDGPPASERAWSDAEAQLAGSAAGDGFGASFVVFDLTLDGSADDLAVSSSVAGSWGSTGRIYLFLGM